MLTLVLTIRLYKLLFDQTKGRILGGSSNRCGASNSLGVSDRYCCRVYDFRVITLTDVGTGCCCQGLAVAVWGWGPKLGFYVIVVWELAPTPALRADKHSMCTRLHCSNRRGGDCPWHWRLQIN